MIITKVFYLSCTCSIYETQFLYQIIMLVFLVLFTPRGRFNFLDKVDFNKKKYIFVKGTKNVTLSFDSVDWINSTWNIVHYLTFLWLLYLTEFLICTKMRFKLYVYCFAGGQTNIQNVNNLAFKCSTHTILYVL